MPDEPSNQIHGYHNRGYLPHKKVAGSNYFVTFRLADSLPRSALERLEAEIESLIHAFPADMFAAEKERQANLKRQREIEKLLDHGTGECWLKRPDIAGMVASAITHFDGTRYNLRAWVVMPNHVHALLSPAAGHMLGSIIKSWKQFTSMRARRVLKITGKGDHFWQPESYDHYVRDAGDYDRIVHYIHWNSVKARLCANPEDWPWGSAKNATAP